jgi:phosphopantetheine--protein transferase-like protein
MTEEGFDWVSDLFAASTSDWTPMSAKSSVNVIYAPFSSQPGVSSRCAEVLSGAEQVKASRFIAQDDAAHFIQRRAFRRYCGALAVGAQGSLSQIDFAEKENGRPYLPNLPNIWFSFSSSRLGFLGAWSSMHAIGVDLEDKTRNVEPGKLAEHFFSEAEAKAVDTADGQARLQTFFQLWCLKEAALKSIGEGLPLGLDAFEFELSPNIRVVRAPNDYGGRKQFAAHVIEATPAGQACAALVIRRRGDIAAPERSTDHVLRGELLE